MTSKPILLTTPREALGTGGGERSALTPSETRQCESRPCHRRRMSEVVERRALSTPVIGERRFESADDEGWRVSNEGGVGGGRRVSSESSSGDVGDGEASITPRLSTSRRDMVPSCAVPRLTLLSTFSPPSLDPIPVPAIVVAVGDRRSQYSAPTVHSLS